MPELSTIRPTGITGRSQSFEPGPAPVQSDARTTAAMAKAAIYANLAKTLEELPQKIEKAYEAGRKQRLQKDTEAAFNQAREGITPTLSDFSVSPSGLSYQPEDPAMREAKASYYQNRGSGLNTVKPTLYDTEMQNFRSQGFQSAPSAASGGQGETLQGSVFGMVPDGQGGWMHDPNDVTDAGVPGFSATKGKYGYNIKDPNLAGAAVSPEQLKAAGIDWHDQKTVGAHEVEVTTPDGRTVRYPIVDALGTPGRVDFTAKAYQELGGPMNKGGGLIPGIKARIVPKGGSAPIQDPPLPPLPDENGGFIDEAAKQVGVGLRGLQPNQLTASNEPGGTPMANIKPAEVNIPVAVPTMGIAPGGVLLRKPTGSPEGMEALMPGENTYQKTDPYVRPGEVATKGEKAAEGRVFASPEEATKAGFDPEGADILPDGTIRVTKFKATGTDARGRSTLTDSAKKGLASPVTMIKDMDGMVEMHQKLYDANKAGPIMGRLQELRDSVNMGDAEFVDANGNMKIANFRIARLLNGPGVLTDKDIERAQAVAPTLKERPAAFAAKMKRVKMSLATDIEVWLAVNGDKATEEQINMANESLKVLRGEISPAPASSSANPEVQKVQEWLSSPEAAKDPRRAARAKAFLERQK